MPSQPYVVESFGGLDLSDDPLEVGPSRAADLVNVDFDRLGRVRTRDGFTRVASGFGNTEAGEGVAAFSGVLAGYLIVGFTASGVSSYVAYNTSGTSVASTSVGSGYVQGARMGTTSAEAIYLANGVDTIRKFNGSAFSSPAGMPKASWLTTTAESFRLVAGGIGAGTNPSRVMFSAAGDAETWPANNFVDLAPGDLLLTGLCSWKEYVLAFKPNRFFVFYGEGIDRSGNPVFNFRRIDGYGAFDTAAGDEGIYFWDGKRVWLTTGDVPARVSEPVEPYLHGLVSLFGETVDQTQLAVGRLSYSLGRLYLAVITSGGGRRTLVFDPKTSSWTLYSLGVNFARTLSPFLTGNARTYWLSTAGLEVFDGATTDNGTAVAFSMKSGKYPVGESGRVAITRESSIVGSGTVTLALDTDMYSGISASAVLGTAPAIAEGWPQPIDQEGTWFQHTLSGSGPATIARLTHFVSSVKGMR